MRRDAIVAVIVATICMLLYIWFRFKDIRFASSAVLALLHDVLVVLAFYVISRISVGNTFIACMLTIVGYSINATIVIFDRIRENTRQKEAEKNWRDRNESITQTLTRSIYTSFTTFVMVAVLYIMGVSSIREFAAPLMVGVLAVHILLYALQVLCGGNEKEICRKGTAGSCKAAPHLQNRISQRKQTAMYHRKIRLSQRRKTVKE